MVKSWIFTNHRATFSVFDLSEERLSVSNILIPYKSLNDVRFLLILPYPNSLLIKPFPFQTILQLFFNRPTDNIAEQVFAEQCLAIEFKDVGTNRFMSPRFWKVVILSRRCVPEWVPFHGSHRGAEIIGSTAVGRFQQDKHCYMLRKPPEPNLFN